MISEETTFKNIQGVEIAARLDKPEKSIGVAVFAHCFTCSKSTSAVRWVTEGLVERGLTVFSFDFTGLGGSGGEFSAGTFSAQADDVVDAVRYVERTHGATVRLLVGHSLGGTAVLYAARRLAGVAAVATIGSPCDPEQVMKLFPVDVDELRGGKSAEVCIAERTFRVDRRFIDDLRNHPPSLWMPEINKSVLLLHSPADEIIDIAHAENIFAQLSHPKSFVSLGGADHLLTARHDAEFAAKVIAGWAEAQITQDSSSERSGAQDGTVSKTEQPFSPEPDARGHQVVVDIGSAAFVSRVNVGDKHALIADEPEKIGGTDTGPTPFGYLLSSLGACTVMTLQVYAARKKYNLTGARVYLDYHNKPQPHIDRFLEIEGDFDVETRQRLLEIADLCPIHKLLEMKMTVNTAYKE